MISPARLQGLFALELPTFADAYPHVAAAVVRVEAFPRHAQRDCCLCHPDDLVILFHPDVLPGLTLANGRGLLRHELAHLCDPDLSERQTDKLAEELTGAPLFYDVRDIQTTDRKHGIRPRPKWLPK